MIMAACWPLQTPPTPKSVLISLADNANDAGECWPSIPTIATRTCFSERAVQNAIKWLEDHKILSADRTNGRHTRYILAPQNYIETLESLQETPAVGASVPPQQVHPTDASPAPHHSTTCTPTPAADAPLPPQEVHQPPQEIPKPPQEVPSNRKEPSMNRKGNIKGAEFILPDWIPVDAWNGFIEMRKEKKKAPTDKARDLLMAELQRLKVAGQDIEKVLNKSTVNGWTDVYAIKGDTGRPVQLTSQAELDAVNERARQLLFGNNRSEVIDV